MRDEIANLSSVHQQLAHMLIVENTSVSSGFADVVTALLLFLTLPCSDCCYIYSGEVTLQAESNQELFAQLDGPDQGLYKLHRPGNGRKRPLVH